MTSFFSRLKSAIKATAQAFRKPKATPPKATPPKATPPKATPPKATPPKATPPKAAPPKDFSYERVAAVKTLSDVKKRARTRHNDRLTDIQRIQLNSNRDEASTFYAATVNLWNTPEGNTTEMRNFLIVKKLGVENLAEAYDLVMARFHELNSGDFDDSVSPPPGLTQLQTELATRVSGNETA